MSAARSLMLRIWRDPAVRSLPVWLLIAVAVGNALAAVVVLRAAGGPAPELPPHELTLALWLPVGIYLLFGRTRARCHRLDLALPIPARSLWLSHSVALALAAASVLAAAFAMMAGNRVLAARLPGGSDTRLELVSLFVPMAAALLLAVALAQSLQPGSWKLTGDRRYWSLMVAAQVVIPAALVLLSSWPWVVTGLFLLLAAVLGLRTWTLLPASFELTADPPEARRVGAEEGEPVLTSAPVGRLTVLRVVFTVLHNAPPWRQAMPLVLYSFTLLVGFFLSGVLELWVDDGGEIRAMNLPIGTYMLFAGAGLLSYHLHRLDPLPIPRRALFGVLTLPTLVIFCLGWAAGRWMLAAADPRPLVEYRIADSQQWVEVDPAFMAFSPDGRAPRLTAPWGETHEAWRRPLFRGRRAALYSPFNTPEKSSARFEALMASRAIERVYGRRIPHTEILERYFEVEGDELVALKDGGFTLLADYPDIEAPADGPETPFYVAIVLVTWLLLLALFARSFRATSSAKLIRGVYWAGLLLLLSALVGQFVLAWVGGYSPTVAHGFLEIFVHRLGGHALGQLAVWVGGLVAIWLAYRLAQAQFLRSELPTAPIQCALVDWGRSD